MKLILIAMTFALIAFMMYIFVQHGWVSFFVIWGTNAVTYSIAIMRVKIYGKL